MSWTSWDAIVLIEKLTTDRKLSTGGRFLAETTPALAREGNLTNQLNALSLSHTPFSKSAFFRKNMSWCSNIEILKTKLKDLFAQNLKYDETE